MMWALQQAAEIRRVLDSAGKATAQQQDDAHEALNALLDEISDWETAWTVLAAHPELPEPIRAMMKRRLDRKGR